MRSVTKVKLRKRNVVPLVLGVIIIVATCIGLWYQFSTDWEHLSELCEGVDANKSYCGQRIQVCKDAVKSEALPRPIVVVAAGAPRSASTFVYNALRYVIGCEKVSVLMKYLVRLVT